MIVVWLLFFAILFERFIISVSFVNVWSVDHGFVLECRLTLTHVLMVFTWFLDIAMARENNFSVSELDEDIFLLSLITGFSRHNLASMVLYYLFSCKRNIRVPIVTYLSPVAHLRWFQKLLPLKIEIFKLYCLITPWKQAQFKIWFRFPLSTFQDDSNDTYTRTHFMTWVLQVLAAKMKDTCTYHSGTKGN